MNSVGLNVFAAAVGLSAGSGFLTRLRELGFALFLWGIAATTIQLFLALYRLRAFRRRVDIRWSLSFLKRHYSSQLLLTDKQSGNASFAFR